MTATAVEPLLLMLCDDLAKLYGVPPHDTPQNALVGSYFHALAIVKKYGEPLSELKTRAGVIDPRLLQWDEVKPVGVKPGLAIVNLHDVDDDLRAFSGQAPFEQSPLKGDHAYLKALQRKWAQSIDTLVEAVCSGKLPPRIDGAVPLDGAMVTGDAPAALDDVRQAFDLPEHSAAIEVQTGEREPGADEPKKRTRRTKEQMDADRRAEEDRAYKVREYDRIIEAFGVQHGYDVVEWIRSEVHGKPGVATAADADQYIAEVHRQLGVADGDEAQTRIAGLLLLEQTVQAPERYNDPKPRDAFGYGDVETLLTVLANEGDPAGQMAAQRYLALAAADAEKPKTRAKRTPFDAAEELRTVRLYERAEAIRIVDDYLREHEDDIAAADGVVPDELLALVDQAEGEFKDKAHSIGLYLRELTLTTTVVETEEKRLRSRRKVIEGVAERLKEYVRYYMQATGITKVEGPLCTVAIQNNSVPSVTFLGDVATLPETLLKPPAPREVNTDVVRQMWKTGTPLPNGFDVSVGTHVRVR